MRSCPLKQQQERLDALRSELPCADQITMIPFSSEKGDGVDAVKEVTGQIDKPNPIHMEKVNRCGLARHAGNTRKLFAVEKRSR